MGHIRHLLDAPKKAIILALCLIAVLAFLGAGTVFATATIAKSSSIGEQNAENFAFADVGIDPLSAEEVHTRFGFEQGQFVYKVDFIAGTMAYAYWIKASDGTVVKKNADMVPGRTVEEEAEQAITLEEAKQAALADAGLTESKVTFTETKRKLEDGIFIYDIEFYSGNTEYEYEIKEETGEIFSKSKETVTVQKPQETDGKEPSGGAGTDQDGKDPDQAQEGDASGAQQLGAGQSDQAQEGDASGAQQPGQAQEGDASASPQPGQAQEGSQSGQPQPESGGQISLDTAKAKALADAGLSASEVTYTKAGLEYEDGIPVYEIEFFTATHEYEYEIDALTGAVRSRDKERLETAADSPANPEVTGTDIGVEQAKAIAVGHAGFKVSEVQFSKAKLEKEDGIMVYEIEFYIGGMEYEYEIHAATGEILKFESEEDD